MGKSKKIEEINYNVFINCPFDEDYLPLLKTIIFSLLRLGMQPKIALEVKDSSLGQFEKIKKLIEESDFSIHDLSRCKSSKEGEYFRLNMPFELGYDFAHKEYKNPKKQILILEKEKYTTKIALSDLSSANCEVHNDDPYEVVDQIRNWFYGKINIEKYPNETIIWDDYNYFSFYLDEKLTKEGRSRKAISKIQIKEFMDYVKEYLQITN